MKILTNENKKAMQSFMEGQTKNAQNIVREHLKTIEEFENTAVNVEVIADRSSLKVILTFVSGSLAVIARGNGLSSLTLTNYGIQKSLSGLKDVAVQSNANTRNYDFSKSYSLPVEVIDICESRMFTDKVTVAREESYMIRTFANFMAQTVTSRRKCVDEVKPLREDSMDYLNKPSVPALPTTISENVGEKLFDSQEIRRIYGNDMVLIDVMNYGEPSKTYLSNLAQDENGRNDLKETGSWLPLTDDDQYVLSGTVSYRRNITNKVPQDIFKELKLLNK